MTLQWHFVATVLYIEIFLVALLLLPFISPRTWQKVFRSRLAGLFSQYSHIYFNIFIAILVMLFLESIREVRKYSYPEIIPDTPYGDTNLHMKLFRAQRNMYISGFALFLWIILRRLVLLIAKEATLMAETEASIKQAKSATDVAKQLMEDKGNTDDNKKNKAAEDKVPPKADLSDIEKKLTSAQAELEKTKEELYKARMDFDAMKKQAESTNAEYDRILEQYSKVEKKLATLQGADSGDKKGN